MLSARIEELKSDVAELTSLINQCHRPRVKDLLTVELRKLDTEMIRLFEEAGENPTGYTRAVSPKFVLKCYDVKLYNYAWDQSEKFVKLFVTIKNVQTLDAKQVACEFTKRSVDLKVKELDSRNFILSIKHLLKDIDESKSHWKVKKDMVVVFLSKAEQHVEWKHLTQSESKSKEASKNKFSDDEANVDPNENLMNLMRKMYNEGDDDLKRTIAKAWTEGKEKNTSSNFA